MSVTPEVPLVSVVMIFRDARRFLDEAVLSVLAQTHSRVELLLVDDGSTDGSRDAAAVHAAGDEGLVRMLQHPGRRNRGMAASRTLGIAHARGPLLAFLDADDVWDPRHLANEVGLLQSHPEAAMVCGRALTWRTWDGGGPDVWSPLAFAPGTMVDPPALLLAVLQRGAYSTPVCSLLVRTEQLRSIGGAPDHFTGMYEDQALLAKLYLQLPAVVSGSATARYRQHAGSASATAERAGAYHPSTANPARRTFLTWLEQLAAPVVDGALHEALEAALEPYQRPAPPPRRSAGWMRGAARRIVPRPIARRIAPRGDEAPLPGRVRFGSLRRLQPVSRQFGYDRGLPVDRWYIERFLAANAFAIRGRVLEVGDDTYTRRFGGDRVTSADVLNVGGTDPFTTYVADLAEGDGLPSGAFDCIVLTQVLQLVFDLPAAVRTLRRVLRPGGILLATVPCISPLSDDQWAAGWCWGVTPFAAARLFGAAFGPLNVEVEGWGTVLTSTAFLQGLASEELTTSELMAVDSQFPMLVTIRAFRGTDT